MSRKQQIATADWYRLSLAVRPLRAAFEGGTYLVGSAARGELNRDVDVRTILPDDEFDAIFGDRPLLWDVFCLGVAAWLHQQTGLPIDYQVQRQTEANAKHDGPRNALGLPGRRYAGGGDATPSERPGA